MAQRRLARQPRQAQIDWTNPLTKGLVAFYSGGRDYVLRQPKRAFAGSFPSVDASGMLGDQFSIASGTTGLNYGSLLGTSSSFTYVVWDYVRTMAVGNDAVIGLGDRATFRHGGYQFFTWRGDNWETVSLNGGNDAGVGQYKTACICDVAAFQNTIMGYRPNGTFEVATAGNSARNSTIYSTLGIGADLENGRSFDGSIQVALVFNRALSQAEAKTLIDNPWQVLDAPTKQVRASPSAGTSLTPGVGSLAITGYVPTVAQTANQALTPNAGAVALTGYAPTLVRTANQALVPSVGSIAFTGYAPTVAQSSTTNIAPGVGSLALTGYAPSLVQTANQSIVPGVGALSFTGYVPLIAQPQGVAPGVGSIAFSGFAPSIAQTSNQSVSPGVGALALTGYAPTISRTANQALSPNVGAVVLTGYAPSISQASSSPNLTPGSGALVFTGYAPSVVQASASGGLDPFGGVYVKKKKKKPVEEPARAPSMRSFIEQALEQQEGKARAAGPIQTDEEDEEEILMLLL